MEKVKRPVVLIGETGTSKTATAHNYVMNHLNKDNYIVINMNFSSRTSSMDVQRHLESNVEKRTKDVYGPPPGKRIMIFIDDMNMPQVDNYGTQQPIALLKLLIEKGGIYDRGKDLNWKLLKDIGMHMSWENSHSLASYNMHFFLFSDQVTLRQWAKLAAVVTKWTLASSPCTRCTTWATPPKLSSSTYLHQS